MDAGVDLETLMRVLIGLEFFAVGVMVFVSRFARAMAIFMLGCFCAILAWEIWRQQTKCGCFGSIKLQPWQMLLIDGSLLLGVILTNPNARKHGGEAAAARRSFAGVLAAASLLLVLGLAVSFAVPQRPDTAQTPQPADVTDPTINPNPLPIPNSWYTRDMDKWVGQRWRDLEIFQIMPRWPKAMDEGKHYIVFYSRTCEHCEEMFRYDLIVPLDGPVTAVEIPFSKTEMRPADAWAMPESAPMEHLELPMGCNWIVQTPLVIAVQDGKVICAIEGDHKPCMGLQ
jgi:hypothetical protein